jgi:hypothetical protein
MLSNSWFSIKSLVFVYLVSCNVFYFQFCDIGEVPLATRKIYIAKFGYKHDISLKKKKPSILSDQNHL